MKQKLKYVSFVVILALFMVALAPNYIGYAEALSAEGSSDEMTSPKKLFPNDESKIIPIIVIGIER